MVPDDETQFEYELMIVLEFFANTISHYKYSKFLTTEELANKMKIDAAQISILENAGSDLRISTLLKFATHFNMSPNKFLPNIKQMTELASVLGGWAYPRQGKGLMHNDENFKNNLRKLSNHV